MEKENSLSVEAVNQIQDPLLPHLERGGGLPLPPSPALPLSPSVGAYGVGGDLFVGR